MSAGSDDKTTPRRPDPRAAGRFRELLASERRSAALYTGLAAGATRPRRQIFTELAAVERKHAEHWANKLSELGEPAPAHGRSGLRTPVLSWLARRFSTDACGVPEWCTCR